MAKKLTKKQLKKGEKRRVRRIPVPQIAPKVEKTAKDYDRKREKKITIED